MNNNLSTKTRKKRKKKQNKNNKDLIIILIIQRIKNNILLVMHTAVYFPFHGPDPSFLKQEQNIRASKTLCTYCTTQNVITALMG